MRRLRITVAVAAVACVVGALASPAFAVKEKSFFGEFTASIPSGGPITPSTPAVAKTREGSLDEFYVGSENRPLFSFECESLKAEGKVFAERSTTFKTEVKFRKCTATRRLSQGIIESGLKAKIGPLEMEFHSNGATQVGKEEAGETVITKGSSVSIKVRGSVCKLVIPQQTVPTAGENPEKEVEGASYSGEREKTEQLKLYPSGFKERLEVDWELKHMTVEIPVGPGTGCEYEREPGGKFNEETKSVQIPSYFEGELEEIEIKKGELFFETAQEHKEKEI
jgi:hypothetical protein